MNYLQIKCIKSTLLIFSVLILFLFLGAYSITNADTTLTITTSSPLPNGQVNNSYFTQVSATGGTGSYSWSVTSGSLPSGLSINPAPVCFGCQAPLNISGTPTAAGTYTFTLMVSAGSGGGSATSATQQFTLTVAAVTSTLTITTSSPLPNGQVGVSYSTTITATGGTPANYTWSVTSGSLPPGLSYAPSPVCFGCPVPLTVSGTPTTAGAYIFTVQVTSSPVGSGSTLMASKQFTLTVDSATLQQITFSASPTSGTVPLSVAFSANGLSPSGYYEIVYGDGTGSGNIQAPPCTSINGCTISTNHTYTAAGTYIAKLQNLAMACAPVDCNVVATATVQVNSAGTQSPTLTASPSSGTAPLAVTFGASQLNAYKMYAIDFDGGSQSQSLTLNPPPCAYGVDCSNSYSANTQHTYQSAGTYTAKLFQNGLPLCDGCQPSTLATVTIMVHGGNTTTITHNLGFGSLGNDVAILQQKLQSLGYFSQSVQPTGYFGSITRAAVIKFQKANGILTTGFVGPLTRNALEQ